MGSILLAARWLGMAACQRFLRRPHHRLVHWVMVPMILRFCRRRRRPMHMTFRRFHRRRRRSLCLLRRRCQST